MTFRTDQLDRLAESGWHRCASIAAGLAAAGLPAPTADVLGAAFDEDDWRRAERAVAALRARFAGARFADECEWGVLLVPDSDRLDTRGGLAAELRSDQLGTAAPDVVDDRLPAGVLGVPGGRAWSMVATVTGAAGVSLGSYADVRAAPADRFAVSDVDTRRLMIRQVWGARVLQCGATPPDCEQRARWTFTVFAGEEPVGGQAPSGTVLHGRVRFRLGKPDRGIGSARVCPAIPIR